MRTIAVVPVVLFHAGWELFSGGFVGVDVFFVISGYLITSILLSELEQDKFSILRFYERRARRILPALMLVVLCCLPFAWLWLFPADMKDFGESVVAVATFSSNILFWWESGYFETAGELKPLLHTWSLAVEEQFYIFFPPILFLLWKLGRNTMIGVCVLALMVSLGLSHWAAYHKPDANFFLLPTRAWELLIGSLCAFWLQKREVSEGAILNQLVSLAGLGAIMASVFLFDEKTPFPSLYALLPTVGTAMVILTAGKGTLTKSLLSLPPMVGIGLISYSAYLWHQPIFAFARHRLLEPPTLPLMLVLGVVSFLLAFLSWKYVEAPFRKRRKDQAAKTAGYTRPLGTAAVSLVACLAVGFVLTLNQGQIQRIPGKALVALEAKEDRSSFYRCTVTDINVKIDQSCFLGALEKENIDFVVFGDSQALAVSDGVADAAIRRGKKGVLLAAHACPTITIPRTALSDIQRRCEDLHSWLPSLLRDTQPDTIILAGYWGSESRIFDQADSSESTGRDGSVSGFQVSGWADMPQAVDRFLQGIRAVSDAEIYVVGPAPTFREQPVPEYLAKRILYGGPDDLVSDNDVSGESNPLLSYLRVQTDVQYIDLSEAFCSAEECFAAKEGLPYLFDRDHLTRSSALMISKMLGPAIE